MRIDNQNSVRTFEQPLTFNELPQELIMYVFSHFSLTELATCRLVDRFWSRLANDDVLVQRILKLKLNCLRDNGLVVFDREHWKNTCLENIENPPLPKELLKTLKQPCPWSNDINTKTYQTHMLLLLPPHMLLLLPQEAQEPVEDEKFYEGTHIFKDMNEVLKFCFGDAKISSVYWAIMKKHFIEGTTMKDRVAIDQIFEKKPHCKLPMSRELVISFNLHYFNRSKGSGHALSLEVFHDPNHLLSINKNILVDYYAFCSETISRWAVSYQDRHPSCTRSSYFLTLIINGGCGTDIGAISIQRF